MQRPLYPRERDPVPIVLSGPQGRSEQVRKISPPTGMRSPDRPARSDSLYRRYPGPLKYLKVQIQTAIVSKKIHPPLF
jgi:hypothetical protein